MNQSQVIYETNHAQSQLQDVTSGGAGVTTVAPLTTKASRKISELRQPQVTTKVRRKSSSRNELAALAGQQRTHQPTALVSPNQHFQWRENPMVEMRPLIGKEQLRQSKLVTTGTSAMDRD